MLHCRLTFGMFSGLGNSSVSERLSYGLILPSYFKLEFLLSFLKYSLEKATKWTDLSLLISKKKTQNSSAVITAFPWMLNTLISRKKKKQNPSSFRGVCNLLFKTAAGGHEKLGSVRLLLHYFSCLLPCPNWDQLLVKSFS